MTIARLLGLSGRVAVATGAGHGIGEGIANVLSEAGAAVMLAARRADLGAAVLYFGSPASSRVTGQVPKVAGSV